MINLLPNEKKREIRAGRTNVLLLRYSAMLLAGILLIAVMIGGTYFVLNTTRQTALAKVEDNTREVGNYLKTKQEADAFRTDLSTAKSILNKEITYSKLLYRIADAVPSNVILDDLKLDSQSLGSSATLNASAKSYADAVRLKNAFERNTALFSDVSFDTLTLDANDQSGPYKIKVVMSVTIKKEAL